MSLLRHLLWSCASAVLLASVPATAAAQAAGPPQRITLGRGFARAKSCDTVPIPGQGILPLTHRRPRVTRGGPSTEDRADLLLSAGRDAWGEEEAVARTSNPANGCTQLWITASPGMVQVGLKRNSCLRGLTGTICVGGAVPGRSNLRVHVDTSGQPAPNIAVSIRTRAATNLEAIGGGHHHLHNSDASRGWTNVRQGRTDADGNLDIVYQAGMRGGVDVVIATATVDSVGELTAGASIVVGLPQSGLVNFIQKIDNMRPAGSQLKIFPTGGGSRRRHQDNHYVQGSVYRHAHEFFRTVATMVGNARPAVYGTKAILIPVNDISLQHGGRFEVRDRAGPVCGSPLDQLSALGVTPGPDAAVVPSAVSHQAHDRGIDFDVGFCAVPQGAPYINGKTCVPCQAGSNPCVPDWSRALPRAIPPDIMEAASNYINSKYAGLVQTTVLVEGDHYHFRIVPRGAGVLPYLRP